MKTFKFRISDNWHAHLRKNNLLANIFHHFNIYCRVLCMGNTSPLIEMPDDALEYKQKILNHKPLFEPVMCIMLTQDTTPEMIFEAKEKGIKFVKFIPIGTSTGAVKGLRLDDFDQLFKIFSAIQEAGLHLLLHAEFMSYRDGEEIHLLEREEMAINYVSIYHARYPKMKITVEHASTAEMIKFVQSQDSDYVRATLTPHHAILTYSDVFDYEDRMINPYNHCLPVLKKESDRQAVAQAMTSGDEHFFAGTDAAPHWTGYKKLVEPLPGIFFGSSEYLRYLEVFDKESAIDKFEDFTSRFGAEYYGYPLNDGALTVIQEKWKPPVVENGIRYCMGGEMLRFRVIKRDGDPIVI